MSEVLAAIARALAAGANAADRVDPCMTCGVPRGMACVTVEERKPRRRNHGGRMPGDPVLSAALHEMALSLFDVEEPGWNASGLEALDDINRVELVDDTGRVFVRYAAHITVSVQDDDRTLKIFLSPKTEHTGTEGQVAEPVPDPLRSA